MQAFNQLVLGQQDYLRAFIAGRCRWPQDIDDLAQEAFVIAFNKITELKEPKHFRSWLSGIALNLLRNHQRKHQHTHTESHEALEALIDQHTEQHEDEQDESLTALRACLLKLDHKAQKLMRQLYSEGLSVKRLAEMCQTKHSTLTMRLHRCRKLLAQCVQQQLSGGRHD